MLVLLEALLSLFKTIVVKFFLVERNVLPLAKFTSVIQFSLLAHLVYVDEGW